jgi:hypothetical protein
MGNGYAECANQSDELFFGLGQTIRSIHCNHHRQDQCSLLRQYIEQSGKSIEEKRPVKSEKAIPFRSYCDTFWNLARREDEQPDECRDWWICLTDQRRCQSRQCYEEQWANDGEWDCSDASDEYTTFKSITDKILEQAST